MILLVVTVASLLTSALPLWMGLPLSVLAGVGVCIELQRTNRQLVYLFEQGQWFVQLNSETQCALQLIGAPLLGEYVMAARFHARDVPGRVYRLFLLPDMVDVESWRRTSLALRQDGEPG